MRSRFSGMRPMAIGALSAAALVVLLAAAAAAGTGYVGTETCLECHDAYAESFAASLHGRLAEFRYSGEARGCEACHGPGEAHVESGGEEFAGLARFADDSGADAEACLDCHRTGPLMDWELGSHAAADVACTSCHAVHAGRAGTPLLAGAELDLCLECHLEQKGKMSLPSHHPVREGHMGCSDCHDVHGGGYAGLVTGEAERELCLDCHAGYRGPFIFEHSPVMEDCRICHDPHGSVANNLLRQNEPFICLQCHQPHFHSGIMTIEGEYPAGIPAGTPAEVDGMTGFSHSDSFKRSMLTKCSQCHQSIHGTDLPSQSIPGQGRALNR